MDRAKGEGVSDLAVDAEATGGDLCEGEALHRLMRSDIAALAALWPAMPALEGKDLFAERYGAPSGVEGLI